MDNRIKRIGKPFRRNGRTWQAFDCECGKRGEARLDHLKSGLTTSCGCYGKAWLGNHNRTHGMSSTPIFRIWGLMLHRIRHGKPHRRIYDNLTVCDRWQSFENFLADMGARPSPKHSIDRIDNTKGYSPDNCRWATNKQQARNTSRNIYWTHNGERLCIAEWAERLGMKVSAFNSRTPTWVSHIRKNIKQKLKVREILTVV